MDFKDFRGLVLDMRKAQTAYFQSRSIDALRNAKALEARVDRELEETQNLFGEGGAEF